MIQKSSYGYNSKLNWSGERCENVFACVMHNTELLQDVQDGSKDKPDWLQGLCWALIGCSLFGREVNLGPHRPFGTISHHPFSQSDTRVRAWAKQYPKIPQTCLTWEVWLYSGPLWDKWMLGHLISELILFAPVPAQLNLKEVHVQVALGGS